MLVKTECFIEDLFSQTRSYWLISDLHCGVESITTSTVEVNQLENEIYLTQYMLVYFELIYIKSWRILSGKFSITFITQQSFFHFHRYLKKEIWLCNPISFFNYLLWFWCLIKSFIRSWKVILIYFSSTEEYHKMKYFWVE